MSNKIFYAWLNHKDITSTDKEIMNKMSVEEQNIAFNEKKISFGTAGYRAKMGPGNHYLNERTYKQLATGYANFLKWKYPNKKNLKVIIAHDNRYNGMFFTDVVATTLFENGIKPIINIKNELLPTPIVSYLIREMKLDGGINITASHNPKEYNGFKCYNNTGAQLLNEDASKIIEFLPNWEEALNSKICLNYKPCFINQKYIKKYFKDVYKTLLKTKYRNKNLQLVYSSMHGTASYYMSKFLNKLGYTCIDVPSQNYPDDTFANAPSCNPEDKKSFEIAINLAETLNVKIALASDPDADRLGIAIKRNNEWYFLNGNQAGIIETYYKLITMKKSKKTPVVISTYISTNLIDRILKKYNGKVYRTPTGFKWIGNLINKLDKNEIFINSFEEAIGALPSTINRDKDSFQTAALILEIIYEYNKKSMDLIDILEKEIYPEFGHWFGETRSLMIYGTNWKQKADEILEQLKTSNLDEIEGWKITRKNYNNDASAMEFYFGNDSWVKFRISGTEPKFKIYTNLYAKNETNKYDISTTETLQNESEKIIEFMKKYLKI